MDIMAGIVLFNPELNRLKENIDAIYNQVKKIVLINNGSDNYNDIESLVQAYSNIELVDSGQNLGVADALRKIMDYGRLHSFDWVLTLDQDSVCMPSLIHEYSRYFDGENIGILTCNIVDRNFSSDSGFKDGQMFRDVSQCITSGSLINVRAYNNTDGFDAKLFIDAVDFDICINMRIHGYRIVKINFDGLLHEVGHGVNVKLFFKDYVAYNHAPARQYYMARNHKYLVMKYPKEFSKCREIFRELRSELIILLYENNKMQKIKSRWLGLRDANKLLIKG